MIKVKIIHSDSLNKWIVVNEIGEYLTNRGTFSIGASNVRIFSNNIDAINAIKAKPFELEIIEDNLILEIKKLKSKSREIEVSPETSMYDKLEEASYQRACNDIIELIKKNE